MIAPDLVAEGVATAASESLGIPGMIQWLGVAQIGLMLAVAAVGGRKLWHFGLQTPPDARHAGRPLPTCRSDAKLENDAETLLARCVVATLIGRHGP